MHVDLFSCLVYFALFALLCLHIKRYGNCDAFYAHISIFLWPCCCYCRFCHYYYCIAFHFVCTVITKPMGNHFFSLSVAVANVCRRKVSMHVAVQFPYFQMEWKSSLKKWASTMLQIILNVLIFSLWTLHLESLSHSLVYFIVWMNFLYKFGWLDVPLMFVCAFHCCTE